MKIRTIFIMILAVLSISSAAFGAGLIDWSKADVTPVDPDTIRVYGLKITGDPSATTYNVDFKFNDTLLKFEPVMASVVANIIDLTKAEQTRGGVLYDKWWKVNGQPEPKGNHPLYPTTGKQSGAGTHQCKECHGWDYKGKDGAYSSGSHFTGIKGVYDARNLNAAHIFTIIKSGTNHNFSAVLSAQDILDLTKFILEGMVDQNKYIIFTGAKRKASTGDATKGKALYENTGAGGGQCIMCHGADGTQIKFHEGTEVLGDVANDNPWETLHKIRNGQPGTPMPSAVKNGLSIEAQNDILTYVQTLPKLGM